MNPSLLVAECLATPWALMPERLHALASVVMITADMRGAIERNCGPPRMIASNE